MTTAGWIIYFCGHNFRIRYVMDIVVATVGFTLLWVYRWLMGTWSKWIWGTGISRLIGMRLQQSASTAA